jgi:hypothetical protein
VNFIEMPDFLFPTGKKAAVHGLNGLARLWLAGYSEAFVISTALGWLP